MNALLERVATTAAAAVIVLSILRTNAERKTGLNLTPPAIFEPPTVPSSYPVPVDPEDDLLLGVMDPEEWREIEQAARS